MRMTPELSRLIDMHTYARPAGSAVEWAFIERFILKVAPYHFIDRHGNVHVVVGTSPRIVWSSHTDTVHRVGARQRVRLKGSTLRGVGVDSCLGSDDTVGVWLMGEMIRRDIPGRYVFHYGEEKGCIGSRALVADEPSWLADTDMVIALDRRGTRDVITHQCSSMTCSDDFALALADQLNAGDSALKYEPSDRGLFTDSESYADDVAECTNLSVGYSDAHSTSESVDCAHALRLLARLCALDTSILPVKRTPGDTGWTSAHVGTDTDTFWRTYDGVQSTPVTYDAYTYDTCYACGEACDDDDEVCDVCGVDWPSCVSADEAETLIEDAEDAALRRASYLDETYAEVQEALRSSLRAIQSRRHGR